MSHHIVLLAGGLGSRLRNTENKPKPLVNIEKSNIDLVCWMYIESDKDKQKL